ncbi:SPOR domain-containing protein [Thioclava sp. 'Guangxiensis']|uniref:SPOR domain-containing protein n=1 Tax=Thioclava sp. 'Guangxiensis' TaxID=3149044 RepID=UPI003878256C
MRMGRLLTSTVILAVLGTAGAAFAQESAPAELPPASYKGRQYVDSQGCVFVRGGFGNVVRWVPRVNRDRTPICNYKPTFGSNEKVLDIAKSAPEATPAPVEKPAPAPKMAASTPAAKPAAKPASDPLAGYTGGRNAPMPTIALTTTPPRIGRAVATAQPVPAAGQVPAPVATAQNAMPSRVATTIVAQSSAPASGYVSPYMVQGAAPAVTIASTQVVAGATTSCPNSPAQATRYMLSDGRSVLRCGAPVQDPASFINTANVGNLTVRTSSNPSGGYQSPYVAGGVAVAQNAPVPSRAKINHNTTRLPAPVPSSTETVTVGASSQQAYAASSPYAIPREVYVKTPNAPVSLAPVAISSSNPGGYEPAFDDGRLNPFRGPRTTSGDAQMRQLWDDSVPAKLIPYPTAYAAPQPSVQVSVSSKSPRTAPAPKTRKVVASGRFVQVGAYADASNAASAKARLRASGLPVASSRTSKGLVIVYAGPFDGGSISGALGTARQAGFRDAYIR